MQSLPELLWENGRGQANPLEIVDTEFVDGPPAEGWKKHCSNVVVPNEIRTYGSASLPWIGKVCRRR